VAVVALGGRVQGQRGAGLAHQPWHLIRASDH
jgi:hypothetical protein